MTTQTLEKIATHRLTLAQATTECPCSGAGEPCKSCATDEAAPDTLSCYNCENDSGRLPRFPGFRQACPFDRETRINHAMAEGAHELDCCNGLGWQVAPADISAALAGLDVWQADQWWHKMRPRFLQSPKFGYTPMPSQPEILAEGLRVVIEVAGLASEQLAKGESQ